MSAGPMAVRSTLSRQADDLTLLVIFYMSKLLNRHYIPRQGAEGAWKTTNLSSKNR